MNLRGRIRTFLGVAVLCGLGAVVSHADEWWSLKPITRPAVPGGAAHPVDAFVRAQLAEKGLRPSPEADRRTLIRRLYFDLIGLPPTPQEIDAFVADPDLRAWPKQVDRLLASPRYGERWARHWLDVVHYGETHGYDKDRMRPNAWPYRDYVIRALNEDKAYARFVQEQVAGDVLFPGTRDGIEALGFLAAGPWDLISHQEVPEAKLDGKIARHLDRDDMVQNTIVTFNSLTVGCAQCHDHKFDPVPVADYYRLQAVFAALDRTDVKYFTNDAVARRFNGLQRERNETDAKIENLEKPLKASAATALRELQRKADASQSAGGYRSSAEESPDVEKWAQVDLGRSVDIDSVTLLPALGSSVDGFGFPVRFKIEAADDPGFRTGVASFWMRHYETFMTDFPNPGLRPFKTRAAMSVIEGRYVRVTAVRLAHDNAGKHVLALAEIQVHDRDGANVALGKVVMSSDSDETPPVWRRTNLTDGAAPRELSPEHRTRMRREREQVLLAHADQATRRQLAELRRRSNQAIAELRKLPKPNLVYAGAVHTGNGDFRGTGNEGGRPRAIHILNRGDVSAPGEEVGPGALSAIATLPSRFNLLTGHGEGERRAALARWLTDPRNPLTWRSIVNRVWQHHFGRGLVDTPNDFGRNGATPTHPELLDWLAAEVRDGGGSLKELHRLILTSATWRQVSSEAKAGESFTEGNNGNKAQGDASRAPWRTVSNASLPSVNGPSVTDPENVSLWRMNRRKLDAETLRDSVLLVSGKLGLAMGGPGFQDFKVDEPNNSPYYDYRLHDPDDPRSHRRSIYRFVVRSQLQPFMTALDCADPSMQVDKRTESLSPVQALALLNNGIMVTMAKHFAARLEADGGNVTAQIERGFQISLGRAPSPSEHEAFTAHARKYGLANTCRVIFNLNEFAFAD